MTEKAIHMSLLIVEAYLIMPHIVRPMAFPAMGNFLLWRPFWRGPFSVEVFIEMGHYLIHDLSCYFGAALFFLPGIHLGARSQRPL
jgi:hypothetical protein